MLMVATYGDRKDEFLTLNKKQGTCLRYSVRSQKNASAQSVLYNPTCKRIPISSLYTCQAATRSSTKKLAMPL